MENIASYYNQLVWQVESGADEALGDSAGLVRWKHGATPIEPAPTIQPQETPRPIRLTPVSAPPPPVSAVPFAPLSATSLDALCEELGRFDGCALKTTAMNLVFAAGNPSAKIMMIGDMPSEDDDRYGVPFSGAAGLLLDKIIQSIGLSRDDVYLTNMIFWRPPGNRTPSEQEIAACLPFTERHIALVKPEIVIPMGQMTMRSLLRTKDSFSKRRGRWARYTSPLLDPAQPEGFRCLPLYSPAYLLRQPAAKRQMWADLQQLRKEINTTI